MADSNETVASLPLSGLRIAVFESRLGGALAEMIARQGGEPIAAPSMREVPIRENPEALAFAESLEAGGFDVVILLTGVGTRYLAEALRETMPLDRLVDALRRVAVVVRGPKPLAVMREWDVPVAVAVPEPNTWRDILSALDRSLPVAEKRIALQEYGKPSPELVEGLEERGAHVTRVPVYRWALPENTAPLRQTVRELVAGRIGAVVFTSAQQVVHLFQIAQEEQLDSKLHSALRGVVIGSIGPTTTEALAERQLAPDIVPEHPKMGHLVTALAAGWHATGKAGCCAPAVPTARPPAGATVSGPQALPNLQDPRLRDCRFLKACRRERTDVTPIWLMRQAGRYMAEYRALRSKVGFLELCKAPDLATEVTVTAAQTLGVDAAILFADILLILEPLGFGLEFSKGEGPVIHSPVRRARDVDRIRPLAGPEPLDFVYRAVRNIRSALPPDIPLIGFAGAPFTLACYAIEGGASRHYEHAKAFLYHDEGAWNALMERLVDATCLYLAAQINAGAQAVQIFDSWVGTLSPADYRRNVLPHMKRLFESLPSDVPTIHFGTDTGSLLELQRDAGGTVIGLDWRVELDQAWERLGRHVAVQGNLDPAVLLAPKAEIQAQARRILAQAGGRPGHIFNLGHGILPSTSVDAVHALVDFVHSNASAC
jgi:uroporphyrinogen decarboxylase